MVKRDGMYSSNKRKKELQRQKKQEEKKQKRLNNTKNPSQGADETGSLDTETESSESAIQEN